MVPSNSQAETFGARLRRLREQYNLSQVGLANLLRVSKLSIWKWECNHVRPRQATIDALTKIFAISEAELLLGRPIPPSFAQDPKDSPGETLDEILGDFKQKIALRLGTTPDKVTITVSH